jgi:hypothetical protein
MIFWLESSTTAPPAAVQDRLHHRHPLGRPQPAGRSSIELIVRRAFTSVQLRTILEENHHQFLIGEHKLQL